MSDIVERVKSSFETPAQDAYIEAQRMYGMALEAVVEIERLRAEVEALRKDAERYRWLRANAVTEDDCGELHIYYWCSFEHYNDVNASIDADIAQSAMKEPK